MTSRDKQALRSSLSRAREALSDATRRDAAKRAAAHLAAWPTFCGATTVALYAAIREEADPRALEHDLVLRGIRVAYPRVVEGDLAFFEAFYPTLAPTPPWNIPEPDPTRHRRVDLCAIDLFVVPGLAFTRQGIRMGYGRGYYDRTLRKRRERGARAWAVGFAFDCQIVSKLPFDDGDERVDAIATESGIALVS